METQTTVVAPDFVSDENGNVPREVTLFQNYPNPFNPVTKLSFVISAGGQSSLVSLKVYDVLGRDIQTLVSGTKQAGKHDVLFDASGLPGGVYLYSLQTGSTRQVKKMLLLR